jgi:hypothetical protein
VGAEGGEEASGVREGVCDGEVLLFVFLASVDVAEDVGAGPGPYLLAEQFDYDFLVFM